MEKEEEEVQAPEASSPVEAPQEEEEEEDAQEGRGEGSKVDSRRENASGAREGELEPRVRRQPSSVWMDLQRAEKAMEKQQVHQAAFRSCAFLEMCEYILDETIFNL